MQKYGGEETKARKPRSLSSMVAYWKHLKGIHKTVRHTTLAVISLVLLGLHTHSDSPNLVDFMNLEENLKHLKQSNN